MNHSICPDDSLSNTGGKQGILHYLIKGRSYQR